ncbi:MAG: hypothetical protein ACPGD5_10005 [Salibacteraceae bacterium]
MKLKNSFYIFLFTFLSLFSSQIGLGQGVFSFGDTDSIETANNLLIEAQVLDGGKPFEGVNVGVKANDEVLLLSATNEKGFFKIELNFDTLFVLEFRKPGYITKKIEIDTRNLPEEDKKYGYDLGLFKLSMLKRDEGDPSLYLDAIARFHYSDVAQIFVVDKVFKKEIKKRFEEKDVKPDVIKF